MDYIQILSSIIIPFLTVLFTAGLTYSFAIRKIGIEMQLSHKEQKYEKLLIAIRKSLYQNSSHDNIQNFLDIKIASYLYASDEVINCIEEVYQLYSIPETINHEDALKKNKNLINAIRKDLGGKKSKLDEKLFAFDYTLIN